MDHKKLIRYIEEATREAISSLEFAEVVYKTIRIPEIKVIGKKKLEALCLLVDDSLKKVKKISIPFFGLLGVVLMLLLTNI
jgi:predicted neutral ceramidase superfamily lipid hydrolase